MCSNLGGGSGGGSGSAKNSATKASIPMKKPKKHTAKEINAMSRSQIIDIAKYINVSRLMKTMGISAEEAARRFDMLVSGNTTAQLKSYVKKYQNEYL